MHCDTCGHDQPAGRFCGHCGALLDEVAEPSPTPATAASGRPAAWWLVSAVAAVLVVGVVVVMGGHEDGPGARGRIAVPTDLPSPRVSTMPATPPPPPPPASPASPPPTGPVFRTQTGTTLLFDDGLSGLVALDLDTGQRTEVTLPGQRPGDQPHRLLRSGLEFVVGRGEVFVTVPGQADVSRELGEDATIAVPAADPAQVWLVTWAGGRIGAGAPTWELVDMSGTVHHRADGAGGLSPVRGVAGGLALRDSAGSLVVHEVATGEVVDGVGAEGATIGDARGGRVAWCDDPCEVLHVTGPDGDVAVESQGVERFVPEDGTVRLAPDGRHVAALARVAVGDAVDFRVRVHDVATGELVTSMSVPLGRVWAAWSDDASQLFVVVAWGESTPGAPHVLGRLTEDGVGVLDLGPYDVPEGTFVTYPAEAAAAWF